MSGSLAPSVRRRLATHQNAVILEEVLLLVGLDDAVRGGVGNAGEGEAVAHLLVVEEGLIGLVDGTGDDLAGAGRASTSAARVGEVDAGLLSGVKDVGVLGDLDDLI